MKVRTGRIVASHKGRVKLVVWGDDTYSVNTYDVHYGATGTYDTKSPNVALMLYFEFSLYVK